MDRLLKRDSKKATTPESPRTPPAQPGQTRAWKTKMNEHKLSESSPDFKRREPLTDQTEESFSVSVSETSRAGTPSLVDTPPSTPSKKQPEPISEEAEPTTQEIPVCTTCNITLRKLVDRFCSKCGGPATLQVIPISQPSSPRSRPKNQKSPRSNSGGDLSAPPTTLTGEPKPVPPVPGDQPPKPHVKSPEKPTLIRTGTNEVGNHSHSRKPSLFQSSEGAPRSLPRTPGHLDRSNSSSSSFTGKRPNRPSEMRIVRWNRGQMGPASPAKNSVVDNKELKAGPQLDKRRELIMGELISTETTFCDGLKEICTKYRAPVLDYVTANPKAPDASLGAVLFSNVDSILKISQVFLSELQDIFKEWTPTSKIGPCLIKTAPFLKIYSTYSKNYGPAAKALDQLVNVEWFSKLIPERLLLDSLLILPIQRIPRYRLLIEDLIRSTLTDHPDHADLHSALALIKDAASYVNAGIDESSEEPSAVGFCLSHLMEPHRKLVLQGTMIISNVLRYDNDNAKAKKKKPSKKPHYFFLFNDILAVVKDGKKTDSGSVKGSGKKKKFGTNLWDDGTDDDITWPLELTWIGDLSKECFELKGPMKTITVQTNEAQKNKWMEALKNTIQQVLYEIDEKVMPNAALDLAKREGTFKFPSSAIYHGWWDLGRMHPYGSFEYKGTCYEGAFVLNLMNGKGSFEYADASIYEGEFRSGQPHGIGEYTTTNGDNYYGSWVKGKRHGRGTLSFSNGDSFVGEFKSNQIEEGSLFINSLKTMYSGPFVNNKYHGKGRLESPKGTYEGDFLVGRENGEGVFISKDGLRRYEGTFTNGLFNGQGMLKTAEFIYRGQFVRDLFEGKGTIEYITNGSSYDGFFLNGMRHGRGKFTGASTLINLYNGEWQNDCRHGQAEIQFKNGDIYIGPVQNGQPHGTGKMIIKSGTTIEGKFQNGVLEGKIEVCDKPGADLMWVDEDSTVLDQGWGLEYLSPPFIPLFQFQ